MAGNRATAAWLARSGLSSQSGRVQVGRGYRLTSRRLDRLGAPVGGPPLLRLGSPQGLVIPPDEDDCASRMIASSDNSVVPVSVTPIPGLGDPCLLDPAPPGSITDFEADIRDGKVQITGVILDPETDEIIGYRTGGDNWQILDREGNQVDGGEKGLVTPVVDPIDFVPTPGAFVKGATVIGRIGIKALGKFVVKEATEDLAKMGMQEVSRSAFQTMKATSIALVGRSARAAAKEIPQIARVITDEGVEHSFDRHAAQWFGGTVTKAAQLAPWRALIEQATASTQIFPWSSGATKTLAHLATIEGKQFVVQFSRETGELVTAFVPTQRQLKAMFELLTMMK